MNFVIFVVCFLALVGGAICGIGGGILIKPFLDAMEIMSVSAVNFLAGCTVLSMTTYSVMKSKWKDSSKINHKIGLRDSVMCCLKNG
jgi:uncharacterized membrane protein YeiH